MNLSAVINLQLVMFALFICGFILTRKGVINSERRKGMSDLLIDLFLPANIICAFLTGISRDVFAEAFQVLVIALGIQIISYLLGLVLYRKEVNGRRMVLRYATICSNAGFMGNPVVEGIYGSQGLLYASVYLIPLRIFMWSAGLSCFTVASPKDIVKKLVHHPCIIAVVIGMALMPFPDVVPSFLLQTMQSCSKCVLPVSMIVIGSILSEADIRKMLKGSTLFYCVVRLLGIPAVTMVVCRLLGMGALVTGVCTVLAGMPAGSTTAILAEKYDGDAKYASECVFLSTVLSLFTMPLCYIILA